MTTTFLLSISFLPVLSGAEIPRIGSADFPVQAVATDAAGNLYVAGTTKSPYLPVKHAFQPEMGEKEILRSTDFGATWTKVGNLLLAKVGGCIRD